MLQKARWIICKLKIVRMKSKISNRLLLKYKKAMKTMEQVMKEKDQKIKKSKEKITDREMVKKGNIKSIQTKTHENKQ